MENLIEFLIKSLFIIIPIYIFFLVSCLLFVINKIIKFYIDLDKFLNKIRKLFEDIDNIYKIMSEENYNIKKGQKETLELIRSFKNKLSTISTIRKDDN